MPATDITGTSRPQGTNWDIGAFEYKAPSHTHRLYAPKSASSRRPDVFTLDYSHPLAQGLVFAGLGQNPGSARYQDESLEGNHGLLVNNPAWQTDPELGRVSQNYVQASKQYVQLSRRFSFTDGAPWSFAGWYSCAAFSGLAGFWGHTNTTDEHASFYIFPSGAWRLFNDQNDQYVITTLPAAYNQTNIWFHLACVRAGSVFSVYINSNYHGGRNILGTYTVYRLMCMGATSQYTWSGRASDQVLYNRAISPAEIALLADRTDPMLGGLVKEHWPTVYFDMGSTPGTPIPAPTGLYGIAQTQAITWYWTPGE